MQQSFSPLVFLSLLIFSSVHSKFQSFNVHANTIISPNECIVLMQKVNLVLYVYTQSLITSIPNTQSHQGVATADNLIHTQLATTCLSLI